MKRRFLRSGMSLLLALVLVRSLIPAGFMPGWVDGALTLIVCDGHAYRPGSSAHQHHHHAGGGSPSTEQTSGDDCSYAQSASPALAFSLDLTPATAPCVAWTLTVIPAGEQRDPPRRYASARGPPALA